MLVRAGHDAEAKNGLFITCWSVRNYCALLLSVHLLVDDRLMCALLFVCIVLLWICELLFVYIACCVPVCIGFCVVLL